MEKLKWKRADSTHNTTQHNEDQRDAKKDTIYDKGEACAAFPAMAASDFNMGDLKALVFPGTHARRLCRPFCFFCALHAHVNMRRRMGSGNFAAVVLFLLLRHALL
jgi:hypothetical protein